MRLNYELLSLEPVKNAIVKIVIEAIVRFKLKITPREFLDFIYNIMVFPHHAEYKKKKNFFEALLPTLIFTPCGNSIVNALVNLDPLKASNNKHNKDLALLFTSFKIPEGYIPAGVTIPSEIIRSTNKFYNNNGIEKEKPAKFIFRLSHLLAYHSDSETYKNYLDILRKIFLNDRSTMGNLYNLISKAIPRNYGSYYSNSSQSQMVPLSIQGSVYKLFSQLNLRPQFVTYYYDPSSPDKFNLFLDLKWNIPNKGEIPLRLHYQLYEYLVDLNNGMLPISYENEKDLSFNKFIRDLANFCDSDEEIIIIRSTGETLTLNRSSFDTISLS